MGQSASSPRMASMAQTAGPGLDGPLHTGPLTHPWDTAVGTNGAGGQLRARTQITDVACVAISPHTYQYIARAIISLPGVPSPVTVPNVACRNSINSHHSHQNGCPAHDQSTCHKRKGTHNTPPLWFPAGNTANSLSPYHFAPFAELK